MNESEIIKDVQDNEKIDLKELFHVLWNKKIHIVSSILLITSITALVSLYLPNIYRAQALIAPVSSSGSALSDVANRFSGLAGLAGVSLPVSDGGDKNLLAKEVIKSLNFFKKFDEKYNILPDLMAVEKYDPLSKEVSYNNDFYKDGIWVREVSLPKTSKPSAQEAHKVFMTMMRIETNQDTGFISISIDHQSPIIAKQWVDWLIFEINLSIKNDDVSTAERSIEYLYEQIGATNLSELQTGFSELIKQQTEIIMLANANSEYLFKTIDPAVIPELKIKPERSIIVLFSLLISALLSTMIVLLHHFFTRKI